MRASVLADDTTGALEIGALLAASGVPAIVTLAAQPGEQTHAVVIDTNTRNKDARAAFRCTGAIVRTLRNAGTQWFYKKTDSTLRGPIGAEFAAVMDALPGYSIVYVPAYPALGRTVKGGVLSVNHVAVAGTAFAHDPNWPVQESCIPRLLMSSGVNRVEQASTAGDLRRLLAGNPGGCVIVCDGDQEDDLAAVANVLAESRTPVVAAGSGGFATYWCSLLPMERQARPRIPCARNWTVVCGSLHPASREQAERARDDGIAVIATPTVRQAADCIDALGSTAAAAVTRRETDGLIIFGGDTARAVFQALQCDHLTPTGEVMPGVPASIAHTSVGDLPVITKAGGFGHAGVVQCILDRVRRSV